MNFVFIKIRNLVASSCVFVLLTATQRYFIVLIDFFPFTFVPVRVITYATAFELQRLDDEE